MVGLGDLPGGLVGSSANGVSWQGTVIVGDSHSEDSGSSYEAFRWTAETGMLGLGDLPGGDFWSAGLDVSADGTVIVGYGAVEASRRGARET